MAGLPHVGLYRRGLAAALFLAPLLFLVDNLIHPEEFKRDHEAEQLRAIADSYTAWQLAHFIGLLAVLLFASVVLGLAFMVRRRRPALGLIAGAAGVLGLIGLGGALALDGVTWGILGESYARDPGPALENALHDVQTSEWTLPYYSLILLWIGSLVALTVGAAREGAVPVWAALLFSAGAVMVGIEGVVADNAYFIASAVVLMLGSWALAAPIWRMSDDEFAGGWPGSAQA